MGARVNEGSRPGPGGEKRGEGRVKVRDLAGAIPSEDSGACPSSPRKVLLVSSSSAHRGDVGPGLDSGSGDVEGPRGTMRGPRMSAMLKSVRGVRGSGPEFMAGRAVAVPQPAAIRSAVAWAPAHGSRSGPPASDPPSALGPSPVCPSSCAPSPQLGAAVGLELVDVPAAVFLQGGEARREAPEQPAVPCRRAAPRCGARPGAHSGWTLPGRPPDSVCH